MDLFGTVPSQCVPKYAHPGNSALGDDVTKGTIDQLVLPLIGDAFGFALLIKN